MLESIYIGMTGLLGYSKGLRVIANNTANMNTPGFKRSELQFSDMFYSNGGSQSSGQMGYGLNTQGTLLSFRQGEQRQTGNDLDAAIDGQGLFILKGESGALTYSRAGQFQIGKDGTIVNQGTGETLMGYDSDGNLTAFDLTGRSTNPAKATSLIKFGGNLSSTATDQTVNGIKVIDALGGEHTLSAKFTNTNATTAGSWAVELFDGTTSVGTGQIIFDNGTPQATTNKVTLTYSPAGVAPIPLTLDFSADVTSNASGTLSTLAMTTQDGYGPGGLTKVTFDNTGYLVLTYSNAQTVKGNRLALARFDSADAVESVGDNQFKATDGRLWHVGVADSGNFGKVRAGMVEISNVDLSQEFSNLVVMQRGYQASSQIISTANDMLQELFSMKGK